MRRQYVRDRCGMFLKRSRGQLTLAQRQELIALKGGMTQIAIAKKFGVSLGCVQYWHKVREQRRQKSAA